jgi:hypothetical protein
LTRKRHQSRRPPFDPACESKADLPRHRPRETHPLKQPGDGIRHPSTEINEDRQTDHSDRSCRSRTMGENHPTTRRARPARRRRLRPSSMRARIAAVATCIPEYARQPQGVAALERFFDLKSGVCDIAKTLPWIFCKQRRRTDRIEAGSPVHPDRSSAHCSAPTAVSPPTLTCQSASRIGRRRTPRCPTRRRPVLALLGAVGGRPEITPS